MLKTTIRFMSVIIALLFSVTFVLIPTKVDARALHALVIGNSIYHQSPLKNPVNDATDMAKALKKFGFSVELQINAKQRAMEEAIRSLTRRIAVDGSVGLFYFAGHGVEYQGHNFLIPIDAEIKTELDLKYEAVDASYVLDGMTEAGNGLNMVIIDACRNNPYRSMSRSASRGLTRMNPTRGSLVLYATQPGAVANDGSGRNGVFTKHLLSAMQSPNLEIEQVFKQTALAVDKETGGTQTPWVEGVVLGNFIFRSSKKLPETLPTAFIKTPPPLPITTPYGHLQVNVDTPAHVKLDGNDMGSVRPIAPLNLTNIAAGDYRLTVIADNGQIQEKRLTIRVDQWTQEVISFNLRVVMAPPAIKPFPSNLHTTKTTTNYRSEYSHISGPSFRCSAAKEPIEILLCRDMSLRKADGIMGAIYKDLCQHLSKSDAKRVRSEQRQWIRNRDNDCPVRHRDLVTPSKSAPVVSCLLDKIQVRSEELWESLSSVVRR